MTDASIDALEVASSARTSYSQRALPVAGDLRAPWRVALLTLLLDRCYGRSATIEQVHVIGWALLDEDTRASLGDAIRGERSPDTIVVRYDPAWARTIDLAVGEGLASWVGQTGRLKLTDRGEAVAQMLWAQQEMFLEERAFLQSTRFSQSMVE